MILVTNNGAFDKIGLDIATCSYITKAKTVRECTNGDQSQRIGEYTKILIIVCLDLEHIELSYALKRVRTAIVVRFTTVRSSKPVIRITTARGRTELLAYSTMKMVC
jgi:hypothetical protein